MTPLENSNVLSDAMSDIHSIDGLKSLLSETANSLGLNGFAITNIPPAMETQLSRYMLCTDLSDDFLNEYDDLGMLKRSTHFKAVRQTTAPRLWRTEMQDRFIAAENSKHMDRTRKFLHKNRIEMGCSFPVHNIHGRRGVVIFVGDRNDLDIDSVAHLSMLSALSYDFIFSPNKSKHNHNEMDEPKPEVYLTSREREIVEWVADGKTSSEISVILRLSDHTINTHLSACMRKLDCVNRSQLVAKALRQNLMN